MATKYEIIRNCEIRRATIKDLDEILRLNLDLFKKEYKEFDKSLNLKWTHSKEGNKFYADRIASRDSFVEVVEYKNKIVGYFCGSIVDGFYRKGVHAEMEDMIIDKKFRSQGIGARLVNNFLDWCKNKKVNYISARVTAKNKLGIDFYRKLGFKDRDLILEKRLNNS